MVKLQTYEAHRKGILSWSTKPSWRWLKQQIHDIFRLKERRLRARERKKKKRTKMEWALCVWRTLKNPPKSEQKVRVEENGKSCWISRGESDREGPRNLARELHLIGVGGGRWKQCLRHSRLVSTCRRDWSKAGEAEVRSSLQGWCSDQEWAGGAREAVTAKRQTPGTTWKKAVD